MFTWDRCWTQQTIRRKEEGFRRAWGSLSARESSGGKTSSSHGPTARGRVSRGRVHLHHRREGKTDRSQTGLVLPLREERKGKGDW